MSRTLRSRTATIAVLSLLALAGGAQTASARPDPADSGSSGTSVQDGSCELRRIGTQLVRCDNLTGAGVAAPAWIPELMPFLIR